METQTLYFRSLLDSYQDKVYNQAYRMLGSREEAEEATQDVFLKIHRGLAEFRGEAKITSWIFRITANVCITRLRRKQMKTTSIDEADGAEGRAPAEMLADEGADPESGFQEQEMAEIVREEVRRLPALWAQAISLHYFGAQSYDEVALAMEIPRPTVATYISRGKQQLAKQIVARTGKDGLYLS